VRDRARPPGAGTQPRPRSARRRDRRGRGLRGPLAPADSPAARSRAEQFDDLVLRSLGRLESRWGDELDRIEVVVADAPDVGTDDIDGTGPYAAGVPLGRADPARGEQPARIVVHRRPIEARASGLRVREDLVHDVVVEQLAALLGLSPDDVDPDADSSP